MCRRIRGWVILGEDSERPCAAIFVLTRHLGCWTLNVSVTTYLLIMTNNKRKIDNKKWVSGYFNHSLIVHLSVKSCDRWRQNSDAVLQFLERTACSNCSYWGVGRKLQCQCTACGNCSPLMIWWIAHVQIAADKLGLSLLLTAESIASCHISGLKCWKIMRWFWQIDNFFVPKMWHRSWTELSSQLCTEKILLRK